MRPQEKLDRGTIQLPNPPEDSVSTLRWNAAGASPILLATTWNGHFSTYHFNIQETMQGSQYQQSSGGQISDAPIVDARWSPINPAQFYVCTKNQINVFDCQTNQKITMGQHDGYCTSCAICMTVGMIATSGSDGNIKFWDPRSNQCAGTIPVGSPCAYLDSYKDDMCVASPGKLHWIMCSQRRVVAEHSTQADKPFIVPTTSLCMTAAPNPSNPAQEFPFCCAGRADGRCMVWYKDEPIKQPGMAKFKGGSNFTFIAATTSRWKGIGGLSQVNSICQNAIQGQVVAGVGDGSVRCWDILKKAQGSPEVIYEERLQGANSLRRLQPITAVAHIQFNKYRLYAFASGYDWSRGANPSPEDYNMPSPSISVNMHLSM